MSVRNLILTTLLMAVLSLVVMLVNPYPKTYLYTVKVISKEIVMEGTDSLHVLVLRHDQNIFTSSVEEGLFRVLDEGAVVRLKMSKGLVESSFFNDFVYNFVPCFIIASTMSLFLILVFFFLKWIFLKTWRPANEP